MLENFVQPEIALKRAHVCEAENGDHLRDIIFHRLINIKFQSSNYLMKKGLLKCIYLQN